MTSLSDMRISRNDTMKKILFVINTLGRAGAEMALLSLLDKLRSDEYRIDLYVLMGQGELYDRLPGCVNLLNRDYCTESVLSDAGRRSMAKKVLRSLVNNGRFFRKCGYIIATLARMIKEKNISMEKLLWRVISDGADIFEEEYDLAVAYIEGGSAYYVVEHVKARKKTAFIHIDYRSAGYTRWLDRDCYQSFDRIFTVSDEIKNYFLSVYPECAGKTYVFHNIINQDAIIRQSKKPGGFDDNYMGARLLTVGRLTYQKAYEVAIDAMKLLRDRGRSVRWYVLGEGRERQTLEKQIENLGLCDDFILCGAVDNPYPYYAQADIYVHATRFEGKSIAIQEAQTLSLPIIASDRNGNREQIINGVDGLLCELTPQSVCEAVERLLDDEVLRESMAKQAGLKNIVDDTELGMLLEMI